MNPAAEHIILWHLKRCDITKEEVQILSAALFKGYDLRQTDAVELANRYIDVAKASAKGLEEEGIIESLHRLHLMYVALEDDERLITALEEVRAILAVKKDNPLSDRIAKAKIAAIASGFA